MSADKQNNAGGQDAPQVPLGTGDGYDHLLSQLRDLLPEAFPDGELDQGQLLVALGLTESTETFSFTWPGMGQARTEARAPTTATLIPDIDASVNWEGAGDVLIEGDNLQVLKLLKNGYAGAVKLIYIDPPYNTGDSFTYDDNFSVSESEYLIATGQVDEQGQATTAKKEKGGRKHAPWLTMMSARLMVARHLLRRDGVFLASIDNNEVHHLRLLLDAVFGAENFVDMITWRGARKGDSKLMGGGQDYILVYARDREWLRSNDVRWRERKEGLEPVYAKVDELREKFGSDYDAATKALKGWYRSLADENPSKAHSHYDRIDERGIWFPDNISSPNYRENLIYDWKGYSPPDNGWRYEKSRMEELDADDRLIYPQDKTKRVQIKAYLHMRETWAPPSVLYRDRRSASKVLDELMGAKVFDDPKSTDVLARLFHALTGDGDLILDFFAGSGSSGHAVWEQNPKDGKTRHWVLVQRPESPDISTESGKNTLSEGYPTIFEITAERLRRVSAQLDGELGFRVFRTRETNLVIEKQVFAKKGQDANEQLSMMLSEAGMPPVKEGADPVALAWELALKATDCRLDAQVSYYKHEGITIYEFRPVIAKEDDLSRLFVCLDPFTLKTAEHIGLTEDDTLILRGDKVDNAVTLTLAPRLRSKLILLERVAREVSL
ncbi:site-specific DNA-methyltransferase [Acetobacter suratthaniensis]|uniref:site-specific DNA-methyltransferase (adenine-specific) n=1 Tax=Acetobacter suratthaniensis TaxID=1502841 RepID=A0ABS3LPB7_9PROT|nr:site-specific DNA-methyltransferase [Acetobacter suratthaniensis]MBO1329211.1 site-specific DNA-methyltransferase [Acetobacter suratthaniensis]MCX2567279.1 site-specific DNA-methyltransferase [Acetobacter suratthaniensis]